MSPEFMKLIYLLIPLAVMLTVEIYFLDTFSPTYFRNGIPGFSSRIPVMERHDVNMLAYSLSDKFKNGFLNTAIIFNTISPNEIAFRDKISNRPSSSFLMHGLITYSTEERAYIVTGRFNWTTIIFFIGVTFFGIKVLDDENRIFVFLLITLLLCLYITDLFKYRRIAKSIASISAKES